MPGIILIVCICDGEFLPRLAKKRSTGVPNLKMSPEPVPHMTFSESSRESRAGRAYRIGVVLNTAVGNMTRYQNLRKYSERVSDIDVEWAPVEYYIQKFNRRPWARSLPDGVYNRAAILHQVWPVLRRYRELDAVVTHLFEADLITTIGRKLWPRLLRVSSADDAPVVNPLMYPLYPAQIARAEWRKQLRLEIDLWRARHTDFFVPASDWVRDILVNECGISARKVHPIHVGVDLETWTYRPRGVENKKAKILFVGGEFERKGGRLLLDVFTRELSGSAELHLVTKEAPALLPPGVFVHTKLNPNEGQLAKLYETADVVVVPTTADTGPLWVFLEALAIGRPVIGTLTGANAEVVIDGETGFSMPIGDGRTLAAAIRKVISDPSLRDELGIRGRQLVETKFNSSINVPRIFDAIKAQIDVRRASLGKPRI